MEALREQILILVTTPIYVVVILLEILLSNYRPVGKYTVRNTLTNLYFMLLNSSIDLLFRGVYVVALVWFYQFHIMQVPMGFWYWFWLIIGEDFLYYWLHRVDHHSRLFWAVHVTHHSSDLYNLTVGFRSSVFQPLYRFIFFIPLALAGFRPLDIVFIYGATQIWGILVHTEHVGKLHWLVEYFLVTPSHHRVHHASNVKYLDRNLGMFLIIWDRLFGTFQKEEDELEYEPLRYGLTKNLTNPNAFTLVFHEWFAIAQDLRTKGSLKDKIWYLIGPPGWSHDGSTLTSDQLRAQEAQARNITASQTEQTSTQTHSQHQPENLSY
jgi:sterol desaturase/sphingolipid hydroxylase (fatty acid hydroxylase superfamily)